MRIAHGQVDSLLKAYTHQVAQSRATAGQVAGAKPLGEDRLTISARARDVQLVQEAIAQVPDVRQERVDAIAQAIAAGKYDVKNDDIAERLLARVVADKLGE
jgi:negative regulator of flagellin synthesis FlgM